MDEHKVEKLSAVLVGVVALAKIVEELDEQVRMSEKSCLRCIVVEDTRNLSVGPCSNNVDWQKGVSAGGSEGASTQREDPKLRTDIFLAGTQLLGRLNA